MTITTDDLLNSIMESLERIRYIDLDDIPNIDLYMDQVTTFMDEKLQSTTRNPGEDKILTKTMINNYAKNDLLPPPVKKKYSKEHIMILIMIYYFKGVLAFNDIQELLKPITEKYFQNTDGFNLEDIYREVFEFEDVQKEALKADVAQKVKYAQGMFVGAPKEDEDFFTVFSLVVQLGFDVYIKRLLIEKLIDGYSLSKEPKQTSKNKKKEPKTE